MEQEQGFEPDDDPSRRAKDVKLAALRAVLAALGFAGLDYGLRILLMGAAVSLDSARRLVLPAVLIGLLAFPVSLLAEFRAQRRGEPGNATALAWFIAFLGAVLVIALQSALFRSFYPSMFANLSLWLNAWLGAAPFAAVVHLRLRGRSTGEMVLQGTLATFLLPLFAFGGLGFFASYFVDPVEVAFWSAVPLAIVLPLAWTGAELLLRVTRPELELVEHDLVERPPPQVPAATPVIVRRTALRGILHAITGGLTVITTSIPPNALILAGALAGLASGPATLVEQWGSAHDRRSERRTFALTWIAALPLVLLGLFAWGGDMVREQWLFVAIARAVVAATLLAVLVVARLRGLTLGKQMGAVLGCSFLLHGALFLCEVPSLAPYAESPGLIPVAQGIGPPIVMVLTWALADWVEGRLFPTSSA